MGFYQESKPASVEDLGLDLTLVKAAGPEEKISQTLYLLQEEDVNIAKKSKSSEGLKDSPRQQIFALYDEFRPRLFRYVASLHLNRDQSEEVIQETFLRLTLELTQGKEIDNLQGWIIRVAHNLAIDLLKRNERDEIRHLDVNSLESQSVVDPNSGPFETYEQLERFRRIQTALLILNPQQRQCFNLRLQGFRYKDIAQAVGISEQRVAVVIKQVAIRIATVCA